MRWRNRRVLIPAILILGACASPAGVTTTSAPSPSSTPVPVATTTAPTTTAATAPSTTSAASLEPADIIPSVVQVQMMVGEVAVSHGSGTVISDEGLILTNAHVATPTDLEIDGLRIAVTDIAQRAPEARYLAEVVASDPVLDLAVIRATETLAGEAYDGALVPLTIGDSDGVSIGDDLLIFGYPAIGGDTITFTRGLVSGFTGDNLVGERAWIKTDATITGGNSGGLAANAEGELVGVPTIAAAGEDTDVADCRPIRDTNRDGFIDFDDDCVPIGGFLNGVRPANLALALIDAAENGREYQPIGGIPDPVDQPDPGPVEIDLAQVSFVDITITDVPPDGPPETDLVWIDTAADLCAWWRYEGMVDGVSYDAIWALNGQIRQDDSFVSETWAGGETGTFWVCVASDGSIDEGIWDLTLNVEGEFIAGNWVAVGPDLEPYDVTITNGLTSTVCYLQIAPVLVPFWGPDWLASDQVMAPEDGFVFGLPAGEYDLRASDCETSELLTTTFTVPDTLELRLG